MIGEPNPGNLRWQIGLILMRIADEVRTENLGGVRNHLRLLIALARPWLRAEKNTDGKPRAFTLPPDMEDDDEEYEACMMLLEQVIEILADKGIVAKAAEPPPQDGTDLAGMLAQREVDA
jgi:hypothetical protein